MTLYALRRQTVWLAVGLLPVLGWAETLDFRQCVDLALAQNPELVVSRSQITQPRPGSDRLKPASGRDSTSRSRRRTPTTRSAPSA